MSRLRETGSALFAGIGVALLSLPPAVAPNVVHRVVALRAADWQADIMAGTGMPIATQQVMDAFKDLYLSSGQFPNLDLNALFTPESFYAVTGIKSLTFDQSLAQSVTILNDTIDQQIGAGQNVVVVGHSQGATVASLEMRHLMGLPDTDRPDPEQLQFVLTGDPSSPYGGILERFAGLTLPSMGVTFSGATPVDTPYHTDIYTAEYDGFADFPKYPLNLLADLNAGAGIIFVHPTSYLDPGLVDQATDLGTFGNISYYIIPTENLPLLDPIRALPLLGNPIADLLQPDLKTLVDLGYGGDGLAYSAPADGGGFGLFPDVDLGTVLARLVTGAETGFHDFVDDLGQLSVGTLGGLTSGLGDATEDSVGTALTPAEAVANIGQVIGSVATAGYSWLLPTADLVTALLTSVPVYDLSLVTAGIQQLLAGDLTGLLDAVGKPIAADMGVFMLGAGWWAESVLGTLDGPVAALSSFLDDAQASLAGLAG